MDLRFQGRAHHIADQGNQLTPIYAHRDSHLHDLEETGVLVPTGVEMTELSSC